MNRWTMIAQARTRMLRRRLTDDRKRREAKGYLRGRMFAAVRESNEINRLLNLAIDAINDGRWLV